jgi:sugar phosphate isomerase/epimerase
MARREFLAQSLRQGAGALAGLSVRPTRALPLGGGLPAGHGPTSNASPVCIFSKHLQWLEWEAMAATAAQLGFEGVDLTVRDGGHVLPERVEEDLPKVAEIIRRAGLALPMVTTGIADARTPHAEAILRTVSRLGISRYRWGGLHYEDSKSIPDQLAGLKQRVGELVELNKPYRLTAIYHTHSGMEVGGSIWDLWLLIKDFDPQWVGVNYDIAHATIEGGLGDWVKTTRLVAPWIKGISVKDFFWGKNAQGQWRPQWCPLGEGMVNFEKYFEMLKDAGFSGPIQLHIEYPLGGAEEGARTLNLEPEKVLAALRRDLTTLRGWLRAAQLQN